MEKVSHHLAALLLNSNGASQYCLSFTSLYVWMRVTDTARVADFDGFSQLTGASYRLHCFYPSLISSFYYAWTSANHRGIHF